MIAEAFPNPEGPKNDPLPDGLDGRTLKGRFAPGNKIGKGNPFNRRSQEVRSIFVGEFSDEDVRRVARKLIRMAKKGDIDAIKEVLNRTIGKVADAPIDTGEDDAPVAVPRDVLLEMIRSAGSRAKSEGAA